MVEYVRIISEKSNLKKPQKKMKRTFLLYTQQKKK